MDTFYIYKFTTRIYHICIFVHTNFVDSRYISKKYDVLCAVWKRKCNVMSMNALYNIYINKMAMNNLIMLKF